jgi:hypothetical protein
MCLIVLVAMILTTFTNLKKYIDILLITLFGKNSRIEFSLSSQYKQSVETHDEAVKQEN